MADPARNPLGLQIELELWIRREGFGLGLQDIAEAPPATLSAAILFAAEGGDLEDRDAFREWRNAETRTLDEVAEAAGKVLDFREAESIEPVPTSPSLSSAESGG